MLSFTAFTAVTVPTLTIGPGTGASIPGSAEIRWRQVILKVRMKWWEAGTVVEVSGYESCTDRCSHGTSRSDLTWRRLSKRLCHSEAKPCQRTGERSAKLRACIGSCLAIWMEEYNKGST